VLKAWRNKEGDFGQGQGLGSKRQRGSGCGSSLGEAKWCVVAEVQGRERGKVSRDNADGPSAFAVRSENIGFASRFAFVVPFGFASSFRLAFSSAGEIREGFGFPVSLGLILGFRSASNSVSCPSSSSAGHVSVVCH
jgi:hypothetical protein